MFENAPDQPLLSDDETSALLDAMREEDRSRPDAQPTELGSPEHALKDLMSRADAAAAAVAKATRAQLLRQTSRGLEVELLPSEVVPRDVLRSSLDPHALRFVLMVEEDTIGLLAVDSSLGRFILDRTLGAPEAEAKLAGPKPFSDLDRRIIGPFPRCLLESVNAGFLPDRTLTLRPEGDDDESDKRVRFEAMMRLGFRYEYMGQRIGEALVAFSASGLTAGPGGANGAPESQRSKPVGRQRLARHLLDAEVTLVAVLGRLHTSVERLLALNTGDVLRLDSSPGEPLSLCIDDVTVAVGNPVVHKGDLAFEVTDAIHRNGKAAA